MRPLSALTALLLSVVIACGSEATPTPAAGSPTVTETSTATRSPSATVAGDVSGSATAAVEASGEPGRPSGPVRGIAGLIPPNFPDSSDADWLTFFETLPSLGGAVGNYSQLSDLEQNQEVGLAAGVQPLPVTGFHVDSDGGVQVTVDFADPAQAAAFLDELLSFVTTYRPAYLGVGNEVNRVWEADGVAFEAWVAALPEIVAAVHDASPTTEVFATFQYEFLRGRDAITGGTREEDWTPLEAAAPHLDLVAFTSYPHFEYESPDELPEDYYDAIAEHTDRPVGFTELGWPSDPIAPLEGSAAAGLGGTPEEQVAFIERLPELLDGVDLAFAMWVWAYDTEAVSPTFASLGLHQRDGAPKPAAAAWRAYLER